MFRDSKTVEIHTSKEKVDQKGNMTNKCVNLYIYKYNILNLHESKCIIYRHVFSTPPATFCTTGTQWSPRSRRAQISPFFMWRSSSMSSKPAPGNWSKCGFFQKHPEMHLRIMNSSLYIYLMTYYHRDLVKMNIICRKPVTMGIALKGKFTWYLLVAPRLIHVFLVCSFAKKQLYDNC